jgi:CTP:molybdopterin cytidylyltransferase MocA
MSARFWEPTARSSVSFRFQLDKAVTGTRFTTLLLAGDREGDEIAALAGRKALLLLAGKAMVLHVLETVLSAGVSDRIIVVANRIADIAGALKAYPDLVFHEGAGRPAASVMKTLQDLDINDNVLVVTADSPLLSPQTLKDFCARAAASPADVTAGLIKESVFRPRFPGVQRTFVRLKGEGYKGCNLFTLKAGAGPKAAAVWRQVEHQRKRPWQLLAHFGVGTLFRAVTGMLDLDGALAAVSRSMGLKVEPIILTDPNAAMDVDRPSHAKVVEEILKQRTS